MMGSTTIRSDQMKKRYTDLNTYFRKHFGCRVQKITVDAGLTCPNRDGTIGSDGCIYCNVKGSGTGAYARGLSIRQQLIRGKQGLARRYKAKKFIAYFQSFTNTYAPLNRLKKSYDEALAVDDIVGLSIGTRPDCVDEPVLSLLAAYTRNHMVWIEYGLQSANDTTLLRIKRGHDVGCFIAAVEATQNRGIQICAHVILGLPGETRRDILATARLLAALGIDGVKIHLLYVIRGTELENRFRAHRYRSLEQWEYIDLVCDFLERLPKDTVIQRLTDDPHSEELIAPAWSLKKNETLEQIKKTLETRDSWQGKRSGT